MNKFLEKVIKKGMDKVGDSMYEKVCPFILYQPKACPRKQVIVVCLLCLSTGLIALASTKATCKHTNAGERRMIEGPWPVSHTVTASQSQGPVTCSGIIWKEKVYYYCPDCGHSVLWDVFTHEKHDVCGMNY